MPNLRLDSQKISSLYQTVFGYVGPPFPGVLTRGNSRDFATQLKDRIPFFPTERNAQGLILEGSVALRRDTREEWYTLPIEPMLSLSGGQHIIRRNTLGQQENTIKERWSQHDYELLLRGVIIGEEEAYPEEDVKRLRKIVEHEGSLHIMSQFTSAFGIRELAIYKTHFPHTPGIQNQAYEIRAYSDSSDYQLFQQT
ncbi:MAG: DUF6046 domain-containing protein [Cytophagales bacterium]|nr:DUF6046 domain-containing protein [Cytophagales bacterium]